MPDRSIDLSFQHRVLFTQDAFAPNNPCLAESFSPDKNRAKQPARFLCFLDTGLAQAQPDLPHRLRQYVAAHSDKLELVGRVQPVPGGELCKNDRDSVYRVLDAIAEHRIDRQSYVMVIGGGAVLDCVGFAAAVAHRGVRLVRMPATTLSQDDSGVGVKNGINGFGQKNFLGTFAVPHAVINDFNLLITLPDRHWLAGFSEAVKVAAIKDAAFFYAIEQAGSGIVARDLAIAGPIIEQSALLHLDHITSGGDPFELTTARPLDFGHWAAHRLETLTDFELSHGEAVSIGIAIDTLYAHRVGLLSSSDAARIINLLADLQLPLHHPACDNLSELLQGIDHFREHLGGELTITLPTRIGQSTDVHELDTQLIAQVVSDLRTSADQPALISQ